MKKNIQTITLIFLAGTFGALVVDASFHPSAFINNAGIDSKVLLSVFIIYSVIVKALNIKHLPARLVSFNNKYIFPISLATYILFSFFEYYFYETFTIGTFRVHYQEFLFVTILSGLVFYFGKNIGKLSRYQQILYLVAPLLIVIFAVLDVVDTDTRHYLVQEDGPLEWIQVILFTAAAGLSFVTAKIAKSKNQQVLAAFCIVFGLGLTFIAIEEISWGQRILGIETPQKLQEINWQDETTLHNIGFVQKYIYIPYIALALWGTIGNKLIKHKGFFAPTGYLVMYFAAVGLYYFTSEFMYHYYEMHSGNFNPVMRWQEASETMLAIGIFAFAFDNFKKIKDLAAS